MPGLKSLNLSIAVL